MQVTRCMCHNIIKSKDDIDNGKYVSVDSAVTVTDSSIQPFEFFSKRFLFNCSTKKTKCGFPTFKA